MKPKDSRRRLESAIVRRGATISTLTSSVAIDVMLAFYDDQRASGVAALDEDGDTLLFEWGVFDWGDGASFQFGLTRQFIVEGGDGDDAITQLQMILYYEEPGANNLGRGHSWCRRPDELEAFRELIEGSRAANYVNVLAPIDVELTYGPV